MKSYIFFYTILEIYFLCINLTTSENPDEMKCVEKGTFYPVGSFDDPSNPCRICNCAEDGTITCKLKNCPKPECGKNLQQPSADGCCKICARKCYINNSKDKACPQNIGCLPNKHYYGDNACCPVCGCHFEGKLVPPGQCGNTCDNCWCDGYSGKVWYTKPKCPEKLECVDPRYDKNCKLFCPQGKTCKTGKHIIKYKTKKKIGNKVCFCVGEKDDWYPRAVCFVPLKMSEDMIRLQNRRCMADASTYPTWKELDKLFAPRAKPPLM